MFEAFRFLRLVFQVKCCGLPPTAVIAVRGAQSSGDSTGKKR